MDNTANTKRKRKQPQALDTDDDSSDADGYISINSPYNGNPITTFTTAALSEMDDAETAESVVDQQHGELDGVVETSGSTSSASTVQTQSPQILPEKHQSAVWAHFSIIKDKNDDKPLKILKAGSDGFPVMVTVNRSSDYHFVKCLLCGASVERKGGNTTNLSGHLKHHHPQEYCNMKVNPSSCGQSGTSTSTAASTSNTRGIHAMKSTDRADTPKSSISKGQMRISHYAVAPMTDKEMKSTDIALAKFITKAMTPISIVEKPSFKFFCEKLNPQYHIPSRKRFTEKIIPDLFTTVKDSILSELRKATSISFTTDIWTNVNMEAFMSLTAHFIDSETCSMKCYTLATTPFPEDHTGENIVENFKDKCNEWGIQEDQIGLITTDGAANNVKAFQSYQRLSCFSHSLDLSVNKCLKHSDVAEAVKMVKTVIGTFNRSSKKGRGLKEKQVEMGLPKHSLINVSHICKIFSY